MPLISVVIPTYNAADFCVETLDSVCQQTVSDWELVLVDDGSTDGTREIIEGYCQRDHRIRRIAQQNAGVAHARNRGFAETDPRSRYIAFLDHDDLWQPDALQLLLNALENAPAMVGAHGLARMVDFVGNPCGGDEPDGTLARFRHKFSGREVVACDLAEPTTFEILVYDSCLCTPGVGLVRREAVEKLHPPFRQELTPSDDTDYWVRLSLLGPLAFVNRTILDWRQHTGNASRNAWTLARGMNAIRRNIVLLPELTREQRFLAELRYRRAFATVERRNAEFYRRRLQKALREGRPAQALHYGINSLSRYLGYFRLRNFWGGVTDRGPLPLNLGDMERLLPAEEFETLLRKRTQ